MSLLSIEINLRLAYAESVTYPPQHDPEPVQLKPQREQSGVYETGPAVAFALCSGVSKYDQLDASTYAIYIFVQLITPK